MDLAKTYLECVESNLALVCLLFAKEYQLYAQLCEKLGKVNTVSVSMLKIKRGVNPTAQLQ